MNNGWPNGGGDIIIQGGSVELIFDDSIYQQRPDDPKRHGNANKKIVKIVIHDENGGAIYDSGERESGLKWTLKILTK